jgi:hypothetical protein
MSGRNPPVLWACLAIAFLIGGCQPSASPAPAPTPVVLVVQVSPALKSLQPEFEACITGQGVTGLVMSEVPARSQQVSRRELALRWWSETPPDGYAAEIGEEELAFIVSNQNPRSEIRLDELKSIYRGTLKNWPGSDSTGPVKPWSYPQGDDASVVFNSIVLQGEPMRANQISLIPDPPAMLAAISADPQALGYIPRRWLDGQVKEIHVSGLKEADLRRPILSVSAAEPQGFEKDWLLCLQEKLTPH